MEPVRRIVFSFFVTIIVFILATGFADRPFWPALTGLIFPVGYAIDFARGLKRSNQ